MGKNNIMLDLIFRKNNQRKNVQKLHINTPNNINEADYVKISGIDQWVTIRGEDKRNPVLFFIHGGPGSTYSIFSPMLRSWEKQFTIVQWDQPGAGKTFKKNGKEGNGEITFDRIVNDGIELAEFLCRRIGQEKLILVGSSVGSLIGIMMVKHRPDLFYAYVGTDQNVPDPECLSNKLALDALREAGDKKGIDLIQKMGPDRTRWTIKDFENRNRHIVKSVKEIPNMIMDIMLPNMLSSPEHKISDLMDIFKGMKFSLNHLFEELMTLDIRKLGMQFDLPMFIFQGDSDIVTPTVLAKSYFDEIRAPYKEFVLIKNAGHLACFAREEQFHEELLKRVRPLIPSRTKNN